MSDTPESSPEISPNPAAKAEPRARKAATPRPKKAVKPAAAAKVESAPPAAESEPAVHTGGEWPEPEAASTGGTHEPSESVKRKRRRRKGKGQGQQPSSPNAAGPNSDEPSASGPGESKPFAEPREPGPRPAPPAQQPPRTKIDPELLAKMAWKIYLAEVSEEGVALIGDNDAKDLSRRCFRLAEIFIEEQSRRR